MDSLLYREILAEYLIPFGTEKYNFSYILHQDNDPKHSSNTCQTCVKQKSLGVYCKENPEEMSRIKRNIQTK